MGYCAFVPLCGIVPRCRNIKVSFLLFSGISTSVMVYKR